MIDAGATVNGIFNSGTIAATRAGDSGSAAAIVDHSGTVATIVNNGAIGVTNAADIGNNATAIDLRARSTGALIRQTAADSGRPLPTIAGNIYLGSGADTLDIQAGTVIGSVDFGGGADILTLSGTSILRGSLLNSSGLAVTIGTGSLLDAQNLGAINLGSLTTAAGGKLGVNIGVDGHTLYNVAGAATFGTDSKILVTLDSVGSIAGTYTIIDAGTLTGAANLTDSIVTLPFLFNSHLTTNETNGQVALDVELKDSGELQLNQSETAIIDAALDAADHDRGFAATFLSTDNAADLKHTLQQLMPEHAGGVFETATKGSRLAAGVLADPKPLSGLWMQQVAWGSSKSIGDTSSYDLEGWGATVGFDHSLGPLGRVGLTAAYLYGKDGKDANELISNHYEGGVYWRASAGPFNAWARGTVGTIDFDSTRSFSATTSLGPVSRAADAKWKGRLYSATGGVSYEARMGRLSIRPNAPGRILQAPREGLFRDRRRRRLRPHRPRPQQQGERGLGHAHLRLRPDGPRAGFDLDAGRGRGRLAPHPQRLDRPHHRLVQGRRSVHALSRTAQERLERRRSPARRRVDHVGGRRGRCRRAAQQGIARRPPRRELRALSWRRPGLIRRARWL